MAHASEIYGDNWEEELVRASLARSVASWRVFKPVVNYDTCTNCWICMDYCPDGAIAWKAETNEMVFNYDYCKGCGICANECPVDAISMKLEGEG